MAVLWLAAFLILIGFGWQQARQHAGSQETAPERLQRRLAGQYMLLMLVLVGGVSAVAGLALTEGAPIWPLIPLFACLLTIFLARQRAQSPSHGRRRFEHLSVGAMAAIAAIAILTTAGILLTLAFETMRFFERVDVMDFLLGTAWSPQTAIREDQVAAEGAFGVLPLVSGTLLITGIALLVAVPVGIMSAVYLGTYAGPRLRDGLKLLLELLAGVPTVVYGFFALLVVGPMVSDAASFVASLFGVSMNIPTQNALSAGLVMGVMIIPFVSSLSDDVMSAIPPVLREGAYALGATKSETVTKVILPAAAPGLVGAFLLAISRAIGETMIVVMAASRSANLTFDPLERVTTFTVQIVALLTGDQEFDSAKTLAAFAIGFLLFLVTLVLNIIALLTVKQFRMRYE